MESWGRLTRCNPSNRSDPCDAPRTDLLLIRRCRSPSNKDRTHNLSTVDPHVWCGRSGRAPPSRACRLRSREEGGVALWGYRGDWIYKRKREGAALRAIEQFLCVEGVPPSPLFIGGGGGEPPWRRG